MALVAILMLEFLSFLELFGILVVFGVERVLSYAIFDLALFFDILIAYLVLWVVFI